jgi:hypothetical protein
LFDWSWSFVNFEEFLSCKLALFILLSALFLSQFFSALVYQILGNFSISCQTSAGFFRIKRGAFKQNLLLASEGFLKSFPALLLSPSNTSCFFPSYLILSV